MNQRRLGTKAQFQALVAALCGVALLVAGLGVVAFQCYLEIKGMVADVAFDELFSYTLISYANLLLLGAAILYLAHPWFAGRTVGLWATGLSLAGVCAMIAGLTARASETYFLLHARRVVLTNLSDVVSLFSAVTVIIYLVMERAYRSRSAGPFVMAIVAVAVLFNIWMVASEQIVSGHGIPVFRSYAIRAHILSSLVAYSAFAVSAVMGGMYLLRHRLLDQQPQRGFARQAQFDLASIAGVMHHAVLLGLLVFCASIALGALAAKNAWGLKETSTLLVMAIYASYSYLHYVKQWCGVRMAWWAIIGFGLTVFYFIGISLLFPGLHSPH